MGREGEGKEEENMMEGREMSATEESSVSSYTHA